MALLLPLSLLCLLELKLLIRDRCLDITKYSYIYIYMQIYIIYIYIHIHIYMYNEYSMCVYRIYTYIL